MKRKNIKGTGHELEASRVARDRVWRFVKERQEGYCQRAIVRGYCQRAIGRVRGLLGYLGSKASQQSTDAVGPGQRRNRTGREG